MRELVCRRICPNNRYRAITSALVALGALILSGGSATTQAQTTQPSAQTSDAWRIEQVRSRFAVYDQHGRGYQSQDGPIAGPGSEKLLVLQPMGLIGIRQNAKVYHQVVIPIDIVTSASVDAIDATTSASRVNEAASIDVSSVYAPNADMQWSARYGFHVEEPVRSVFLGGGLAHGFAQNNTTLAFNVNGFFDVMSNYTFDARKRGVTQRVTLNANLSLTQVLSETTLLSLSYGVTEQLGTLQTQWNSVPVAASGKTGVTRTGELFPRDRLRHAWATQFAQHIPWTRTTAKISYRYYNDTIQLQAHTTEAQVFQYVSGASYLRGSYRFHHQRGAGFFTELLPSGFDANIYRTSDSDLATFKAHELGAKLFLSLGELLSNDLDPYFVDVGFVRYTRSNDLNESIFSIGYSMFL